MSTNPSEAVRWLIAGTGRIARRMAADLAGTTDAVHVATLSRSRERAVAFNAEVGSKAEAFADAVEAVRVTRPDIAYIATPHALHAETARPFIAKGVGVLVEKPFTCTAADTEFLFDAADRAGVYACEAMWTRFNPVVRQLRAALAAGEIGEVTAVHAAQGFRTESRPTLWTPMRVRCQAVSRRARHGSSCEFGGRLVISPAWAG